MKRYFLLFAALYGSIQIAFGQKDSALIKPDYNQHTILKGLIIDLGTAYIPSHNYMGMDNFFEVKTGRPSTVNIYMHKNISLFGHYLSISPGLGLGLDNYYFKNDLIIAPAGDSLFSLNEDGLRKSKLSANYVDIPLELRFASGPNYKKAFKIAVGGKFGVLFSGNSKIKYDQDGTTVIRKFSDQSLNRIRYGLTGRIAYGHFGVFAYYSLSSVFKAKYGPELTPVIVGITLSSF